MVAVVRRKWTLIRSWDRLQIPKPFSRIDGYFGDPMHAHAGETTEQFRLRIEEILLQLEAAHEPAEAKFSYRRPGEPIVESAAPVSVPSSRVA